MDWKTMLSYISGSVDEELLLRNEYLVAENRVLRNQLQGLLRLIDTKGPGAPVLSPFVFLDTTGFRAGVQLPRCAARGLRRVCREPQGKGLGAAANRLRGRRDLGRNPGAPRACSACSPTSMLVSPSRW